MDIQNFFEEDNPIKPIKGSLLREAKKEQEEKNKELKMTPIEGVYSSEVGYKKNEKGDTHIYLKDDNKIEEGGYTPVSKRELKMFSKNIATEEDKKELDRIINETREKEEPGILDVGIATLHGFNTNIQKMLATGVRALADQTKPIDWDKREDEIRENMTTTIPGVDNGVNKSEDIKIEPFEFSVQTRKIINKITSGEIYPWTRPLKEKVWENFGKPVSDDAKTAISLMNKEHQRIAGKLQDEKPGISNLNEFLYATGSAGLSTGTALGISFVTGNPYAGAAMLSALESSDTYNNAKDKGLSTQEALRVAYTEAGGTFLLETAGLDGLTSTTTKGVLSKGLSMLKGAGAETGTEIMQTWYQNLIAQNEYDEARKIFDGTVDTAIASLPSALLFSAGGQGVAMMQQQKAIKNIQDTSGLNRQEATEVFRELQGFGSIIRSGLQQENGKVKDINLGLSLSDMSGEIYDKIPDIIKDKALESETVDEFENFLEDEEISSLSDNDIGIEEAFNTVNGMEGSEDSIAPELRNMREEGFTDSEIIRKKIDADLERYSQKNEETINEARQEVNTINNRESEIDSEDAFQNYLKEQFDKDELTQFEEDFQNSEARVLAEMEESGAGRDILTDGEMELIAKDEYPEWIPSDLRDQNTLEGVITHLRNNTTPNEQATNQRLLYKVATREVLNRSGLSEEQIDAVEGYMLPTNETIERTLPEEESTSDVDKQYLKERRAIEEELPRKWLTPREASIKIRKAKKEGIELGARKERQRLKMQFEEKTKSATEIREEIRDYAHENLSIRARGRLLTKVKNVSASNTEAQNNAILNDAIDFMDRLADRTEEKKIMDQVRKEIKTTEPTGNKKPIGKYTADIQSELDGIRNLLNLSETKAEQRLEDNIKILNSRELLKNSTQTAEELARENAILEKYTGNKEQKRELLDMIVDFKEQGKFAREIKNAKEEQIVKRQRDIVKNRVTGGQGIKESYLKGQSINKTTTEKAKQFMKAIGSNTVLDWQGLMTVADQNAPVTVKPLAEIMTTIKQENKYKVMKSKYISDLGDGISDIYGIEQAEGLDNLKTRASKIHSKIHELVTETVDVNGIEMTRDELIKRYMEVQDPTLSKSLREGNGWGDEMFNAVENTISEQDKQFAEWQLDQYRDMYKQVNEVYRDIYGVDLPFNEFYSPIKRTGVKTKESEVQFLEEAFYRKSVLNKHLYDRKATVKPIERQGSLAALDMYMNEASYFTSWAKKVRQFDKIFNDSEVRMAFKQEFPSKVLENIDIKLSEFEHNGRINTTNRKILDGFRKNFAVSQLAIKPALAVKQLVSSVAYAEEIGFTELSKGLADFARHPIRNYKTLIEESAFIRERGVGMERDIRAAMKDGAFESFKKKQRLQNKLLTMLKMGDKGAIVAGSWAMRNHYLKQGMEMDEIITRYEDFSAQTQQSADFARLANIQSAGSIAKLFTMFKSAPRAQFQKEVNAMKSLFREGGFSAKNIGKASRTMFIYHVLIPTLFQFVSNMGGWTEEDKKDYLRAGILGNMNSVYIAGDVAEQLLRKALGQHVFDGSGVFVEGLVKDITRGMGNIDFSDISLEDISEASEALASASGGMTGLPIEYAYDVSQSIKENEFKKAGLEALGWSEYYIDRKEEEEDSEQGVKSIDSIIESVKGDSSNNNSGIEDILNNVKEN